MSAKQEQIWHTAKWILRKKGIKSIKKHKAKKTHCCFNVYVLFVEINRVEECSKAGIYLELSKALM